MPSGIANRISWSVEIRQTSPLSPSHSAFSGRLPPFIIFYLMGRTDGGWDGQTCGGGSQSRSQALGSM